MNLFRKSNEQPEPPALPPLHEARELLPASAKSPDAQRLNLFNPDEEIDEATDEDLAFLNALIQDDTPPPPRPTRELRRERAPEPEPADPIPPAPPTSAPRDRADDMEVFRELATQRQRTDIAKQLGVDHVDMGDLLEDLHTTRAALRHRRKAA